MSQMRDEIEKYINEHYHTLEENPWEKYPNFTTYKHVVIKNGLHL